MSKGKFLLYYCGKPVYEGDETHLFLEQVRKESDGNLFKHAKKLAKEVEEKYNNLNKKK